MICFNPNSSYFPKEPELPEEINGAIRASLVQWLRMRLEEFGDECMICSDDPEAGIIDVIFPGIPADEIIAGLRSREIECIPEGKRRVRFVLSAGQPFEPLDKVQAVLMELLDIS